MNEFPLLLTVLVHCLLMESLNRKSTRWEQETRWTTNETFQTFGEHWWNLWRIQETHEIEVKTPRGIGWGQEEAWLVKFVVFFFLCWLYSVPVWGRLNSLSIINWLYSVLVWGMLNSLSIINRLSGSRKKSSLWS